MQKPTDKNIRQVVGSQISVFPPKSNMYDSYKHQLSSLKKEQFNKNKKQKEAMEKFAAGNMGGGDGGFAYNNTGGYDITFQPASVGAESFLQQADSQLTRHRRFAFYFNFAFYKQHPIVRNTIDLHVQNIYSPIKLIGIQDKAVMDVYEDCINKINLQQALYPIIFNYILHGEDITIAHMDETLGIWSRLTLRFPHSFSVIPKKIIMSDDIPDYHMVYIYNDTMYNDFLDRELANIIGDPMFSGLIRIGEGEAYEINPLNIWHTKAIESLPRGYSDIEAAMNYLLYERLLISANYRIARDRIRIPEFFKLGDLRYDLYPTQEDIDYVRSLLQWVSSDPSAYAVLTPDIEYVGTPGESRLLNTKAELDMARQMIMTALWSPLNLDMGQKAGSSELNFSLEKRYKLKRQTLEDVIHKSCFLPMAIKHGFIKRSRAELDHNIIVKKSNDEIEYVLPSNIFDPQQYGNTSLPSNKDAYEEICSITNEIIYNEEVCGIQPRLDLLVKTASQNEYEIPTVLWTDHIRLSDTSEKVSNLINLMKEETAPNVLPLIFEEMGYDYDSLLLSTWDNIGTGKDPMVLKLYKGDPANFWATLVKIGGGFQITPDNIGNILDTFIDKSTPKPGNEPPTGPEAGGLPPAGMPGAGIPAMPGAGGMPEPPTGPIPGGPTGENPAGGTEIAPEGGGIRGSNM